MRIDSVTARWYSAATLPYADISFYLTAGTYPNYALNRGLYLHYAANIGRWSSYDAPAR